MSNTADFLRGATFASSATKELKIIDLSDAPLKPNVVREGKQVPFVPIDKGAVDKFIGSGKIVTPDLAPRVVTQTIPPGTKVARGASVDIVLATRITIPIEIIKDFHPGFVGNSVGNVVDTVLVDSQVNSAVLDFETAAQVPAATRTAIIAALAQNDVIVNEADPARGFEAAFRTLKGAAAFK